MAVRLCSVAEACAGNKFVKIDGREFAVVADGGKYYAVENYCPHKGGPLGLGPVNNGAITCPWHRFRFDLETGKSVTNPAMRANIRRVVVEGEELLLETIKAE